jgi:hypothetical protein
MLEILCIAILALIMSMVFRDEALAASLTLTKQVAWDQRKADLDIKAGTNTRPLDHWIMYFRDSPTGPVVSQADVPYDAARLTGPNAAGDMTYTSVPFAITMNGTGGTTLQKCITVTAYGTHTPPPPKETAPSNQVCIDFALPPDAVTAPGAPTKLLVR